MTNDRVGLVSDVDAVRELGEIIHEERRSRGPVWVAVIGSVAAAGVAVWGAVTYLTSLTGYLSTYALTAFGGGLVSALLAWVAVVAHRRTRYSFVFHARGVRRLGGSAVDVIRFDEHSYASVSRRNSQIRVQGSGKGVRSSTETLVVRGYGAPPFTVVKDRTRWLSQDEETPFDRIGQLANAANHERIAGDLREVVIEP